MKMGSKVSLLFVLLLFCAAVFEVGFAAHKHKNFNSNGSALFGIELPVHLDFDGLSSAKSNGCTFSDKKKTNQSEATPENRDGEVAENAGTAAPSKNPPVKLHLKRRSVNRETEPKASVVESTTRDITRIQTFHTRITEKKNQDFMARSQKHYNKKQAITPAAASPESYPNGFSGQLMATLESGVSLGSGEYFMDVFVGTPPKHYSLILDTGSDLNWIQCLPCYDCFNQNGDFYDPRHSTSFQNINCKDPKCQLVSSPDPPQNCKAENQSCPYFYWYGDSSNTTGDFALETFTVNLTSQNGKSEFKQVENVMFGCGHWNRGLFHGAAGLLGLGRGPLSFSSQLQSHYGHSFSYCLVDRNSDSSSKLIFGEDEDLLNHPDLNFTSLVAGKENLVDTFYYVQIKSISVGGETLDIPVETWKLSPEGGGGTIIDSGTTLSYFSDPAYKIIKRAFMEKVKEYPLVKDFPILDPCYNVTGVETVKLPEFEINFSDGAVWSFPVENYFIRLDPEAVVCLAILGTPRSALSIIGNYQQQNFHILYDVNKSRLGFAPMNCAHV